MAKQRNGYPYGNTHSNHIPKDRDNPRKINNYKTSDKKNLCMRTPPKHSQLSTIKNNCEHFIKKHHAETTAQRNNRKIKIQRLKEKKLFTVNEKCIK